MPATLTCSVSFSTPDTFQSTGKHPQHKETINGQQKGQKGELLKALIAFYPN